VGLKARKRHQKITPDTELTGQTGINLIEQIVLEMGQLWHAAGPFDAGIDGRIELRDTRSKQPLNKLLGAQSKCWERFTGEDENGFEFVCDAADIDYWMRSSVPVILVCSHAKGRKAWFKCVTEWFRDAHRRADRRVVFDKHQDAFDSSCVAKLFELAARDEPALPRLPQAPSEDLVTNLLPILEHGRTVWSAPTEHANPQEVRARYEELGGARASDYLIRDKRLHSLRDPRECALEKVCDASDVQDMPAEEWSESDELRLRRYWVELLRRSLLQQVKDRLSWQPERQVFYFRAPEPLDELSTQGAKGPRKVVKVSYYEDPKTRETRLGYVRHHAFRPGFQLVDGTWHLEVEPTYLFTSDGHRPHRREDVLLAGIKRLERNLAVIGQLQMWEHVLTRPPSLLKSEPPLLSFGKLVVARSPIGIDDAQWQGKAQAGGDDAIPGQEELAA
jgi:hypothetical protein